MFNGLMSCRACKNCGGGGKGAVCKPVGKGKDGSTFMACKPMGGRGGPQASCPGGQCPEGFGQGFMQPMVVDMGCPVGTCFG